MKPNKHRYFTSESVTEGHPDKMADQVSDAILDAILEQDKSSHVACETMLKTGVVIVAGEIAVTPIDASYVAIVCSASSVASQTSLPMQPWKCRSIIPGIA